MQRLHSGLHRNIFQKLNCKLKNIIDEDMHKVKISEQWLTNFKYFLNCRYFKQKDIEENKNDF